MNPSYCWNAYISVHINFTVIKLKLKL
uniref:Uncharacterized protein n=1 Tax=Anguilla anguilla TaxID=7936 RepID=A0A0E9W015_ANGAN